MRNKWDEEKARRHRQGNKASGAMEPSLAPLREKVLRTGNPITYISNLNDSVGKVPGANMLQRSTDSACWSAGGTFGTITITPA